MTLRLTVAVDRSLSGRGPSIIREGMTEGEGETERERDSKKDRGRER